VKPVKLLHEAETEMWEAATHYEEQQPGLGVDFVHEVRTALRFIQKAPELWPAKARGMRRYLIDRFPFAVHYRVESDRIRVIAIAHGRRKPGYWKKRL
jgi:toxin ParE1/3/4